MPSYYNLHETYRMQTTIPHCDQPVVHNTNEPGRRMWTIAEIKAELPDVPVEFPDGTERLGTLAGRKCPFPQVTVKANGTHLHLEASWPTIQHVLNWGTALLA